MLNGFSVFVQEEIMEWKFHPVVLVVGLLLAFWAMFLKWHNKDYKHMITVGMESVLHITLIVLLAGVCFSKPSGEYQYKDITNEVEISNLQDDYELVESNLMVFIVEEKE